MKSVIASSWIPALIIVLTALFWSFWYRATLFTVTDVDAAEKAYAGSQYVLGENAIEDISDATLYTFAGYRYIQGENPTQINFEHPPFGKYVLGLSWFLFANMTVINLLLYAACLWLVWVLSRVFFKQLELRLSVLILLASVQLLPDYTFQPMLDIQLLFYTLVFLVGLVVMKPSAWRFIILGFSLGAYVSTKYFFPTGGLLILLLVLQAWKEKSWKLLVLPILTSGVFYLTTYIRYFISNPNPVDYLQFEWFRFRWWTGDRTIPPFLLFSTIFFGEFEGWWADGAIEYAPNWTILWPITFVVWLISLPLMFIKKKITPQLIVMLFSLLQLALYIFGSASNERYLIQLLPFWIIGLVVVCKKLLEIYLPKVLKY